MDVLTKFDVHVHMYMYIYFNLQLQQRVKVLISQNEELVAQKGHSETQSGQVQCN